MFISYNLTYVECLLVQFNLYRIFISYNLTYIECLLVIILSMGSIGN